MDFAIICAGLLLFGLGMYVILDGFDLGVGILFPWAPTDECRDVLMSSIAPVWDGNETWLIYGVVYYLQHSPWPIVLFYPPYIYPS